ncbi:salicylate hydroxylase [Pluteus cervinus]|uniref:Salicylate hydroxylase n=1 Tax=Pluteus cervinus TaxID=181527 RepID=A0ACD3AY84_9AGAR|nr:salicylate hydroxylase [Pluteus cervinus]
MASKDFTIAFVGGGMVGLACAIPLSHAGFKVDVYESAKEFGEVGAGVVLACNGRCALKGLGLLDPLYAQLGEAKNNLLTAFQFISGVGDNELIYPANERILGLYRPDYMDAIMPLIDPSIVHFGKQCILVDKTPPEVSGGRPTTTLHFADGTTAVADLVIGADGIKSITRRYVTGSDDSRLSFTGTSLYRDLIPMEDLRKAGVKTELLGRQLSWFHHDKHLICFPVKNDTILNVGAFPRNDPVLAGEKPGPWVEQAPQQELLDDFPGWGRDAQIILDHMKAPGKWYIHHVSPVLESYVKDHVVLIGDAAHGMLPHLGAGLNQGFEDAYTLYRLLTHPKTNFSNLRYVLEIYSSFRSPRANMVLTRTARMGEIYDEHETSGGDNQKFIDSLQDMWTPIWGYYIDEEVDALLERLGMVAEPTNWDAQAKFGVGKSVQPQGTSYFTSTVRALS